MELTHFNEQGRARMVDVSEKVQTYRVARAAATVRMAKATMDKIKEGSIGKGDVLAVAQVAGIMAAKKNSELIPMCHPLNITKSKCELEPVEAGERLLKLGVVCGQPCHLGRELDKGGKGLAIGAFALFGACQRLVCLGELLGETQRVVVAQLLELMAQRLEA